MFKVIKQFVKDCALFGSFYAHHIAPRFLHPIVTPILAVTAAPVMLGVLTIQDMQYFAKNRALVRAHSEIGPIEHSIREVFGETAIEGFQASFDGIEMNFNEASLAVITPEGKGVNFGNNGQSSFGTDRETCAQDLVANFAAAAMQKGALEEDLAMPYQYFIKVDKAGALKPSFYRAEPIFTLEQAAAMDSVYIGSHRFPSEPEEDKTHFAILPVDDATHNRLLDLGL